MIQLTVNIETERAGETKKIFLRPPLPVWACEAAFQCGMFFFIFIKSNRVRGALTCKPVAADE